MATRVSNRPHGFGQLRVFLHNLIKVLPSRERRLRVVCVICGASRK